MTTLSSTAFLSGVFFLMQLLCKFGAATYLCCIAARCKQHSQTTIDPQCLHDVDANNSKYLYIYFSILNSFVNLI